MMDKLAGICALAVAVGATGCAFPMDETTEAPVNDDATAALSQAVETNVNFKVSTPGRSILSKAVCRSGLASGEGAMLIEISSWGDENEGGY